MLQVRTKHFADISYPESAVLHFPVGIPAFEHLTRFLMVERASASPLVFFQSLEEPEVCLPAVPIPAVDSEYELSLSGDDAAGLGFADVEDVRETAELACFAIVSAPETGPPTANLLAPVVINLAARRGVQAVRPDTRYSHRHPLTPSAREAVCS